MPSDRLTIRLPPEARKRLRDLAAATGKTDSEVVRDALTDYSEKQGLGPTCYDVAKKAGFLGCDNGGPTDLSTNPEHMRGFGSE